MGVKLKADYSAVLHMPVLKEGKDRVSQLPGGMLGHQSYTQPGEDETNTALEMFLLFIWTDFKIISLLFS